jgi:hypothetical protein
MKNEDRMRNKIHKKEQIINNGSATNKNIHFSHQISYVTLLSVYRKI